MNPTATRRLGWLIIILGVAVAAVGLALFFLMPNMCSNEGDSSGFLSCLSYPASLRYWIVAGSLVAGIVQAVWGVFLVALSHRTPRSVGEASERFIPVADLAGSTSTNVIPVTFGAAVRQRSVRGTSSRFIASGTRKPNGGLSSGIAVLAFIVIAIDLGWLAWIAYEGLTRYVH